MFYCRHISGRLGSDGSAFVKDLKTLRGLKARMQSPKGHWLAGTWFIYTCTEETKYNSDLPLVGSVVVAEKKQ
jgi:hypothetical protein